MSHALLLAALLAADPDGGRPGQFDAPVLIDLAGGVTKITGVEPLAPGTTCLTYEKAESVRDDLAEKNARAASLEAALRKTDPAPLTVALFTAGGITVGASIATAIICASVPGRCGLSPPR